MHDRLKQCRLKYSYSQKFVALTVGVSMPTVSQWESGVKRPSIENLISLASLYHTTVDYLVGYSDDQGHVQPATEAYTAQEIQMIRDYRTLTSQGRDYIRQQFYVARQLYSGDAGLSNVEKGGLNDAK